MLKAVVRVLLIEDNEDDYVITRDLLEEIRGTRFELEWVSEYDVGLQVALQRRHDVYLVDYLLGEHTGLELLRHALAAGCHAPMILLTGQSEHEIDLAAMKTGAADFLRKDQTDPLLLDRSIRYALERARTLEALRESEERYRSVVNNVREVIFQVAGGLWTFLNPAWEMTTGFNVDESIGRNMLDYIHPDDRHHINNIPAIGESWQKELRFLKENGDICWFELNARYLRDKSSQIIGFNGSLVDVSERKRVEIKQQRLLDELANAVRAKDAFLASMSHELRTPLNAILGKAEVLVEGVHGPMTHNQVASLQIIQESGRHLLDLINDILDLSKIEAGKIDLAMEPVAVDQLMRASLRQIQEMARKKNIMLYSMHDETVITIQGDERRVRQIMINLLTNAVKFTPAGGEVGLEVEGDAENGVVYFHVRDTGIGIADTDMERLFQRFVQVDSSLARQHGGTGLGLALVQHFTEMHNGEILVESEVGKGSCFTVAFPWDRDGFSAEKAPSRNQSVQTITPTPQKVAEPTPVEPASDEKVDAPLILVAEDNEMNITMVSDYLEVKGYRVDIARNGVEAVEHATAVTPDLILMDMQMPLMDGLEATRQIRLLPALQKVPIIGLTALVMPGDRERCIAAGADDYMSKPVSLRGLVQRINGLLERE